VLLASEFFSLTPMATVTLQTPAAAAKRDTAGSGIDTALWTSCVKRDLKAWVWPDGMNHTQTG
jgi:hypothetical protein